MKKFVCLILVAIFTLSLSACTTKPTTAANTTTKTYKVAMVSNASINDGGWNSACYKAMCDSAAENNFETAYTENVGQADWVSAFRKYADLGYNVIFAPGSQYDDAIKEIAGDYPKISFVCLNGVKKLPNVTNLMPNATQIGYLSGALAGLQTKTNVIGFIGGMELDTTKGKLASYEAAAKKVNPNVQVVSAYAGSFSDVAKGKEIAKSMVSTKKVDVIFGDASAVDAGARQGLKETPNRYSIAQPADVLKDDPEVIISSVCTNNSQMLSLAMKDFKSGTFGNKTITGDLSNGGLSMGKFGANCPKSVQDNFLKVVDEIKNGTFISK